MERIALEDLVQTSQFKLLTPQQQDFVTAYVKSGVDSGTYDGLGACTAAYKPASLKIAGVMVAQIMGNSKVKKVLDLHFGRTPQEAFLLELEKTIQHSTGDAKVRAQELYARLAFGDQPPGEVNTHV
jgi:hypothetical protein